MEYSFLQFGGADDGCNIQLPVNSLAIFSFFVDNATFTKIDILDKDGNYVRDCTYTLTDNWVTGIGGAISDLTCFRLGLFYGSSYSESNLLRYTTEISETTLLKYLCYEPQFGFDYSIANSYNKLRLPIIKKDPQFPQEDKVYADGNGVSRLISSKIDTEYELETEYMPIEWHEKLVIALAHDEVWFGSTRLQKSAPYEINYDEFDELECGTRLYKASAKLKKNTTIRNNNC